MNVLFLTHSFPRSEGDAAGSFILRLAVALRNENVKVQVVAPASAGVPEADEIEGIRVERFRYAPRRYERLAYTGNMASDVASSWTAKLALVSFLGSDFVHAVRAKRNFEPQVVHAHWWFPNGVVGTWVGGLAHIPLVTTLHGTDVRFALAQRGDRGVGAERSSTGRSDAGGNRSFCAGEIPRRFAPLVRWASQRSEGPRASSPRVGGYEIARQPRCGR